MKNKYNEAFGRLIIIYPPYFIVSKKNNTKERSQEGIDSILPSFFFELFESRCLKFLKRRNEKKKHNFHS